MSSSTRLYERLGKLPQDPNDPESLQELIVVAFGAFERYYVCWKNKREEYRQDAYGLPQPLQEWLFPPDGSTRDFPSLQVVFGRGDEYFASDKNGKCEYKETEARERIPHLPRAESPERDMQSLRRQRTLSWIRPTSDPIPKPFSPIIETPIKDTHALSRGRISIPVMSHTSKRRPQSMSFHPGTFARVTESENWKVQQEHTQQELRHHCNCHHHHTPKPTYKDASMQTDPEPSSPISSNSTSSLFSHHSHSARSSISSLHTPIIDPNPVYMGRMLDYFKTPGYRLGDALRSTYQFQMLPPQGGYRGGDYLGRDDDGWKASVMERRHTV